MFLISYLLFSDTGCHQMKSKHLYKNGYKFFNWLWLSVAFAVGGCGSSVLVAVNGFAVGGCGGFLPLMAVFSCRRSETATMKQQSFF